MSADARAILEWLADRHGSAYTIARLAEWIGLSVPKTQGALARLREDGLVRYFEGDPGTWAVTRPGFAEVKFDAGSVADRYRMALEAQLCIEEDSYSDSARKNMRAIAVKALS